MGCWSGCSRRTQSHSDLWDAGVAVAVTLRVTVTTWDAGVAAAVTLRVTVTTWDAGVAAAVAL